MKTKNENEPNKRYAKNRGTSSYAQEFSGTISRGYSNDDIGTQISKAFQRVISYQADDGSFSFTRWENRYINTNVKCILRE